MKAKEYVEIYRQKKKEKGDRDAVFDVLVMFLDEVPVIAKIRSSTSDSTLFSILNEMSDKWRKLAELSGRDIANDGFERFIKNRMPDVYAEWKMV